VSKPISSLAGGRVEADQLARERDQPVAFLLDRRADGSLGVG
jgi:hypothetical protein